MYTYEYVCDHMQEHPRGTQTKLVLTPTEHWAVERPHVFVWNIHTCLLETSTRVCLERPHVVVRNVHTCFFLEHPHVCLERPHVFVWSVHTFLFGTSTRVWLERPHVFVWNAHTCSFGTSTRVCLYLFVRLWVCKRLRCLRDCEWTRKKRGRGRGEEKGEGGIGERGWKGGSCPDCSDAACYSKAQMRPSHECVLVQSA